MEVHLKGYFSMSISLQKYTVCMLYIFYQSNEKYELHKLIFFAKRVISENLGWLQFFYDLKFNYPH